DYTARVWDVESGKPIGKPLKGHRGIVLNAAFSPDGKRIVTGSSDYEARVWDAESGKRIGKPFLTGFGVISVGFSPDGQRIFTACGGPFLDDDIDIAWVWDVESDKRTPIRLEDWPKSESLNRHGARVILIEAAFSPDCHRIVTASSDDTVCVWDAESGE